MDKVKLNRESRRLFELMHKSHETELDENEALELNTMLKESEELRLIFLSMRDQHISLDERLKNRRTSDHVLGHNDNPEQTRSLSKSILQLFILLSVISISYIIGSSKTNKAATEANQNDEAIELNYDYHIATISSSINTYNTKLKKGQDLKAGWLTLNRGKIILEMSSGMEISVEAPAKLELINSSTIKLEQGKVRLQGSLGRKGFSVETAYGKISDQGADFGVHIDSDLASSTCFKGEIAFVKNEAIQIIIAGKSFDLINGKFIENENYNSADNVRKEASIASQRKLSSWRQFIQNLKYDPDTAFLYQFSPTPGHEDQLIQEVNRSEVEPAHGKIIGAKWEQGRFPGTNSLKFDSPNDRVKFFLNENFEAMTFNMWLKLDHLTNNNHLGIFLSEKWSNNQFTVQYLTMQDGAFFKIHSRANYSHRSSLINPNDIIGKWFLLSFTFDISKNSFHIYLNGKNIDNLSGLKTQKLEPTFIGWCDLMNWVPLESSDIRNTPGQVDFLSIHRKAFSHEEVQNFYLISKTPEH